MSTVIRGPWPGTNLLGVVPGQKPRRRPLPQRVRVGKHGPVVLMYCADCKTPWAPGTDIPRDRLCGDCRAARASGKHALFDTDSKGT